MTGAGRLERLARLPERMQLAADHRGVRAHSEAAPTRSNIPFAIGESALQPVVLPTRTVPNMLVMGRQSVGKTTTLAAFGQAIISRFTPEQAQITIIDPKTSLIGKIQGPHVRAYAYTADDIDEVIAELAANPARPPATVGSEPGRADAAAAPGTARTISC